MTAALTLEERVARIESVLGLDAPTSAPVPWALRRTAVLREVARLWGISADELTGPSKIRALVLPRAAVVMVLRTDPPMSYAQIGRLLHRDHSTAIHLERVARAAFDDDIVFAARVTHLRRQIAYRPESVS